MALTDDPRLTGFGPIRDIAKRFKRRNETGDAVLPPGAGCGSHFAWRMKRRGIAPINRYFRFSHQARVEWGAMRGEDQSPARIEWLLCGGCIESRDLRARKVVW